MKTIKAADLFAGAGGTSQGLKEACRQLGRKLELELAVITPAEVLERYRALMAEKEARQAV